MAVLRAFEACMIRKAPPLDAPSLDLGCGDGRFLRHLFGRCTVGLDLIEKEARRARRSGTYRIVVRGDAHSLPFPSESFSSVISNCVVEHIPDADRLVAEVSRILRPGGNFTFTTWTPGFSAHLVSRRPGYVRRKNRILNHHSLIPADDWSALLRRHGMELAGRRNYLEPGTLRRLDRYENISLLGAWKLRLIHLYMLAAPRLPAKIIRAMRDYLDRRFSAGLDCERGVAVLYHARRISPAAADSDRRDLS